jgi:hypothetical protein
MSTFNYQIKVTDIIDNADGSAKVVFDIEDGFEEEIIKMYGWEKWEQEKFEQLFISALENYIKFKEGTINDGNF